jgi:hypothetical protein
MTTGYRMPILTYSNGRQRLKAADKSSSLTMSSKRCSALCPFAAISLFTEQVYRYAYLRLPYSGTIVGIHSFNVSEGRSRRGSCRTASAGPLLRPIVVAQHNLERICMSQSGGMSRTTKESCPCSCKAEDSLLAVKGAEFCPWPCSEASGAKYVQGVMRTVHARERMQQ